LHEGTTGIILCPRGANNKYCIIFITNLSFGKFPFIREANKMKILLAVDGSEYSERAASFLTRFPFSPEDKIIILHVISEIPYEDDSYANIRRFMKRMAPQVLDSAAKILKPAKAKIIKRETEGYPDATIMETAENGDFDLVVMGTRGLKGVKSFFVGSVTRSVAINSATPLLVTRTPQWQPGEHMKVLLASDGSDSAGAAADLLALMPFPPETEYMILNVPHSAFSDIFTHLAAEKDRTLEKDAARIRDIEHSQSEQVVEKAKNRLSNKFSHIQERIQAGDPAMEILNAAEKFRPDIIAVGCRGLKGMKGMMGSVSRRILTHSPCPVLIGKARTFKEEKPES
jgi:nucleotide-binding universal stress UspA family protein